MTVLVGLAEFEHTSLPAPVKPASAGPRLNALVTLDATQLTDQQLQKTSTQRTREVIDQLRGVEPPKPAEPDDPDRLN